MKAVSANMFFAIRTDGLQSLLTVLLGLFVTGLESKILDSTTCGHTFCTRMASAGGNLFMIMQIAGHKDTATAKRHTYSTDEHLLAVMGKMSHQFSQHSTLDNNLVFSDNRENKVNINS